MKKTFLIHIYIVMRNINVKTISLGLLVFKKCIYYIYLFICCKDLIKSSSRTGSCPWTNFWDQVDCPIRWANEALARSLLKGTTEQWYCWHAFLCEQVGEEFTKQIDESLEITEYYSLPWLQNLPMIVVLKHQAIKMFLAYLDIKHKKIISIFI